MYSQLQRSKSQIRLLRLHPKNEANDIVCELFTVSLDESNTYEALSYVWGSGMGIRSITLDDTLKPVTDNLESALLHLRDDTKVRTLWIDALCINQEDLEERRWQVQLMGQIYSGAMQVVVWLEPRTTVNENTVKMIKKLGNDSNIHWFAAIKRYGDVFLDLHHTIDDEWWKRIWTVQEAVLARRLTFQRGRTRLSGKTLVNFAKSYNKHVRGDGCCNKVSETSSLSHSAILHGVLDITIDNILRLNQLQLKSRTSKFDEVASLFRNRKATNPLDMVYGLLGISQGITESSIDYSLSKTQVYELATRDCISYNQNLNILSNVINYDKRYRQNRIEGVVHWRENHPSWVPDWTSGDAGQGRDIVNFSHRTALLQHYNACGSLEWKTPPKDFVGKLHVDGVCCDVVEIISTTMLDESSMSAAIGTIEDWRNIIGIDKDPSRAYVGGDTISEAFWRTLCVDTMVPGVREDGTVLSRRAGPGDRASYLVYWYTSLVGMENVPFSQSDKEYFKQNIALQAHVAKSIARRTFFVSQKGYMGLSPLGTKSGDRICVLAGGKVPFILRAIQEDGGEVSKRVVCRLLGDAYVHGLMDGETMKMVQDGVAQVESFELI